MTRLLLIGPLPITSDVVGGAKMLFREMAEAYQADSRVTVELLNTSRAYRSAVSPLRLEARAAREVLRAVTSTDADAVILNTTAPRPRSASVLSAVWAICAARRKPLVLRFFGGALDQGLADTRARCLAENTWLRSPLILVETQLLRSALGSRSNMRTFPNSRRPPLRTTQRNRCRRFLFLGQLRREKGWMESLIASRSLPEGCSLTIAGPAMPSTDQQALWRYEPRAQYAGEVAPGAVPTLLDAHDALLCPTYHPTEGHPGVVIEALQRGLVPIVSRWRALPELVEHETSGLLVPPRSPQAIAEAMKRLTSNDTLFRCLSEGARARGQSFDGGRWHETLLGWVRDLL